MKTLIILLFNISIVLFQILALVLAIITGEMLKSNIIYLANVLDNWSATPIKEIKLFDFDCPINYEPLQVNKYAISCDFNLDRDFLEQKSVTPALFLNEKNQSFCAERMNEFFYFQIKQKTTCDTKIEKDCGILDTIGNRFCVRKNSSCPLNGVAIKHYENNISGQAHHTHGLLNQKIKHSSNTVFLPINDNYSLITTTNHFDNSSFMVVDIDIIQDKGKRNLNCGNLFHKSVSHKFDRKLKKIKESIPVPSKNNSNNFPDESEIADYHNHFIDVEYRPYIGWKQECLHHKFSTPDNVEHMYEKFKKLFESKQKITVFYVFFTVVLFFILIYFFTLHLDLKDNSHSAYLIATQIIFIMIIVPLIYVDITIYLSVINNEKSVDTFNCSDKSNNAKLSQLKENMRSSFVMDCCLLLILVVNLILSGLFICCGKKDSEENQINTIE